MGFKYYRNIQNNVGNKDVLRFKVFLNATTQENLLS